MPHLSDIEMNDRRLLGERLGRARARRGTNVVIGVTLAEKLLAAQPAMEAAVRAASPARDWVAIPHAQWRDLLDAHQIGPDVQPGRAR